MRTQISLLPSYRYFWIVAIFSFVSLIAQEPPPPKGNTSHNDQKADKNRHPKKLSPEAIAERKALLKKLGIKLPPKRNVVRNRSSHGTRSNGEKIVLTAFVPESGMGESASNEPSIFWIQDFDSEPGRLELCMRERGKKREYSTVINTPLSAGFHHHNLTSLDVALEPGKQYTWSLTYHLSAAEGSLKPAEKNSLNPVASGEIGILPSNGTIEGSPEPALTETWYDVIGWLSDNMGHPELAKESKKKLRAFGRKIKISKQTIALIK